MISRYYDFSQLVIRLGIIGATFAAAVFLAPRASENHIAALLVLGGAIAVLRKQSFGPVVLVGATITVPFAIGTGTETSINIAVLLVVVLSAIWWLDMLMVRRKLWLASSPANGPIIAFIAVSLLAFGAGSQPWLSFARTASLPAQAGGLALYLLSALAFLLVANRVRDVGWLQAMVWVFLALAAIHVVAYLVPSVWNVSQVLRGRARLGSVFWIWLVALAFSQALLNTRLAPPIRLALFGLVGVTFYVLLVPNSTWNSGWLPAIVAVVGVILARAPRLVPLLVLVGAAAGLAVAPQLVEFVMGGDNEYSLSTRMEAWRILLEIIGINPILGIGFSNYYWYTPLFPILGYAVSFNSHNNYVDLLAQMGVMGLICFLWFAWALGRQAWQLRSEVKAGFEYAFICGALGGLMAMLVSAMLGDWVLPFVYNIGYSGFRSSVVGWLFLGGIVVIAQAVARRRAAQEEASVAHA